MSYITVGSRVLLAGRMECPIKSNREIGGRGMFGRALVSGIIAHHSQWWATGRLVRVSCRWSKPMVGRRRDSSIQLHCLLSKERGVDLAPSLPVGY